MLFNPIHDINWMKKHCISTCCTNQNMCKTWSATKQENKESMTCVLVTPQHHKLLIILLSTDYQSPKRISQTGKFLHREFITLCQAFMQNRVEKSCFTWSIGKALSLSTLTNISQNTTWPVVNMKRVHLSKIFPVVKYLHGS